MELSVHLYANIISIKTPVLFTQPDKFTPDHTFISLINLDFDIQTYFYNGMDDYTTISIFFLPHLHCYITHHNKSLLHYNTEAYCT